MRVSPRDRKVLDRITAEAEAEGILVLRLNRYGCIVLAPNLAEVCRYPSWAVPGHDQGIVNHEGHEGHEDGQKMQ